jgi:preprotein translocase subunit SecB
VVGRSWATLAWVLLSAVLGVLILKRVARMGAISFDRDVKALRDPMSPIAGRALSILAAGLLILPGFFTDTLGLLLLLPPQTCSRGDAGAGAICPRHVVSRTWWSRRGLQQGGEVQPDIQVQVSLDARKRSVAEPVRGDHQVQGDLEEQGERRHAVPAGTGIWRHLPHRRRGRRAAASLPADRMPALLFPFVRRIISDVTRDGGFPPLNIDTVDFLALYRQELSRRAQAQKADAG